MQNPTPTPGAAGTMPAVDPSSWELGLDGRLVPKSTESNNRRRNNAPMCEMCSKKKTKCEVEGSNTACTQCMRRNTRCKFTTRREKRESLKSKIMKAKRSRSQYIKELEERVRKTESLLKAAGLLDEESIGHDEFPDGEGNHLDSDSDREHEQDSEGIQGSSNWESDRTRTRSHAPIDSSNRNPSASLGPSNQHTRSERRRSSPGSSNLQHLPVLKMDGREESRYYGRSSSLSILSREGIEWIKGKTGDVKFLSFLTSDSSHDSPWDYWRPDVFHDLFDSQVFKPLPSRAEVFSLLKDYFRTVNRLFPLYHEASFMRLVEWQYTQQTCDDAARWASINIILSLAYEYRFSNSLKPEKDREKAWLYFKNAMSVFTELTLRRTDILSVQALLGMALFLRGNSGTQSALPIITAAMRACHRMGLHRNLPRPHLPPIEQEQRKRVFWIAYILDQSTCVRSGSAPTQHIDDFDVDLPIEGADDGCPLGNHKSFFRQLCRLTIIKGRVYTKLYSTKALNNKSVTEIFRIIDELYAELEEWKKHSVLDVQLKMKPAGEDFLLGFASAGLRFVYYNSLIMIHRIPLIVHFIHARYIPREKQKTSDLRRIANQSSASAMICVQAARDTLKLVNGLPWGDIAWIWSLLYYVFLAVITIFANILQDSTHPRAKEDVHSLNMASTFFTTLIPGDGPCRYARFMAQMSSTFERIARAVLERDGKTIKNEPHRDTRVNNTSLARGQESIYTTTSPVHSSAPSVDMPHVENSVISENTNNTSQDNSYLHGHSHHQGTLPDNNPSYTTPNTNTTTTAAALPRIYNTATTNPNTNNLFPMNPNPTTNTPTTAPTTNDTYNFSGLENIAPPPPGFWQIPLMADWEFGNQFLESMGYPMDLDLSAPSPSVPPPPQASAPVSASGLGAAGLGAAGLGILPDPSITQMGYQDYGTQQQHAQAQAQVHAQAQAQAQAQLQAQMQAQVQAQDQMSNMAWFGGFLGSY